MQKVFDEVNSLDKRCYEKFSLSEDILMEHAALAIAKRVKKLFKKNSVVLIASGAGNNGADGICLARLLAKSFDVRLYMPFELKSDMAKLQLKRTRNTNIKEAQSIQMCDVVVDCLFGSGLNRPLDEKSQEIIETLNTLNAYKIACDIPSGIQNSMKASKCVFKADETITMGALKKSLFFDFSKDFVGDIKVANLGLRRDLYEKPTNCYLLQKRDLKLPIRDEKSSHKGTYGHVNIIAGEKKGASIISAKSAFNFGAGLVTLVCSEDLPLPNYLMQSKVLTKKYDAIAVGMGLGEINDDLLKKLQNTKTPLVIDADLFHSKKILKFLDALENGNENKNIVLTPHPKEFSSLLSICDIDDISVEVLQNRRFEYVKKFCKKYPNVILLLKGANTLIGKESKIYINDKGSEVLAKGGSGDVLSGLIASLIAQGYSLLDATISASLAHSIAGNKYKKNNYSLTPDDLIKEIKIL